MLNVLFRQECNSILWDFFPPSGCNRKRKLISQSKKELENFIGAKFGDHNPGRASQKALRTVPPVRSQDTVYISFLRQMAVH